MVHLSCSDFLPSFLLLRLTLLILLVSSKTKGLVKLPADVSVPAVFVFGDSVVDTGNNNNRTTSFARSNFPPYGRDFQGGIPTGRFSNGKVPSDLIGTLFSLRIHPCTCLVLYLHFFDLHGSIHMQHFYEDP